MRIEVRSTTDIHFYVDYNASNGIQESECGTGVTTTATASALTPWLSAMYNAAGAATTALDVDYIRGWQDDAAAPVENDSTAAPLEVVSAPSVFDGRTALADLMAASENIPYDASAHLDTQVLNASKGVISPLVVATGLIVDSISSLADAIIFNSDINLIGRPYFNADTAGFAIISKGLQAVKVLFEKEYLDKPVVSAAISVDHSDDQAAEQAQINNALNGDTRYVVADQSTKGFTIMLNKPATSDIQFNWLALAVKDAKTFAADPNDQQTFGYQAPSVNSQTTVASPVVTPPPDTNIPPTPFIPASTPTPTDTNTPASVATTPTPDTNTNALPDTNTPAPIATEPAPIPPADQTPTVTQPVATEPTPDTSTPTATTATPDTTTAPITTSTADTTTSP